MTVNDIIAHNMKNARLCQGHSLQTVAAALGISYQQIQKYESGRNRISAERLYYLSCFYKMPIQAFFAPQI